MTETKKLTFFVPGEPQGKGRPRFSTRGGRVRTYTPDKTAAYEESIREAYLIEKAKGNIPFGYTSKPISLVVTAFFRVPKRTTKAQMDEIMVGYLRPTKKPDADNIIKIVADALNGWAYLDDAQIIDARCVKWYGPEPGLQVEIWEV